MKVSLSQSLCGALLGVALVLVACGGGGKQKTTTDAGSGGVSGLPNASASPGGDASRPQPSDAASPTAADGLPQPKEGSVLERIVAPSIRMDAPVETKGINARGEMEDPSGKDAVAWYDFTEFPGFGGNAVFSGHVDWFTGELGVFGRMREMKEGEEVLVKLSDGMEMKYRITTSTLYETAKAPIAEIVGRTEKDTLTFITCDGTFNRATQDYSHRRIVRAERVA